MAQRKSEVWLTSVVEDELVDNAMVLAESLRKTKTTRTIAAIASRNLSVEKRAALRKAFDSIFYMDDTHFPDDGLKIENEQLRAKIFVFSMHFFQKCVFISPNSLVLENMDKLFEDKAEFRAITNTDYESIDLSFFVLSPRLDMWESLWTSIDISGNVFTEVNLWQWLKTRQSDPKIYSINPDKMLVKFSIDNGAFLKNQAHASVIQFIDVPKDKPFASQIESLKDRVFGIPEKLITATWLQTYGEVLELMKNPNTIRSPNNVCYHGNEPIAIVGMSCRYPGANNVEEFWNMLYRGDEGIREPPAFRWTKEHSLRVTPHERKTNAGFLSTTVDEFDAKFFGVSPKEAAYMDPQARLLHEVVWESLEDSGIDPLSLYGTHTGIFTGSWMNDYKDIVQGSTERDFFRTYMGNSIGAAAARLSFLLGLTGPSIATESGCSSAIVAVDLAVKSLRSGESNLALAGGVNLLLHPFTSNIMDYVIAPNGRCKTFDSKADGFGRAEGCGVLVLKRMSDALRDRDNIWALIRGSAVSQEGLSRSLGTPTVHCEALVMQLALQDANVKPSQVSFVETHGTGTAVGDPMEVAAIAKAYYSPDRKQPLVIGSVKTNVGHTESCSGITGIMKTVLAMQHEMIPKHRNMENLNPEIFLDSIPATIPLENVPWPKVQGQARIAGVSSFGITGTDGHVIIEEAPDYELPKFTFELVRPTHILKISGKTGEALDEMLKEYENLLSEKADNDVCLADIAFSANVGRATFNHRAYIIANNNQEAVKAIKEEKYLRGEVKDGETHQICFLFTGQGSQYPGMAKTLYETSPVFRVNFDACDRALREMYNISIRQVLWESDSSSKELSRTIYSQASIFCIEYCLLKLWQSWGIQPDYVLGHSLGEFAAAVAAEILEFKDALKLVAERSRLIDNLPFGSMLVIKASKPEVEKLIRSGHFDLDIAAVNNSEQTVVAGKTEKIESFLGFLKKQGMKAIILDATHAFHSRQMDPMLEQYRKIAQSINYKMGNYKVQYVSGMEGRIISDSSEINADYWVRHTREQVSFVDACTALRESNIHEYLEVGPQPILSSFVMVDNEDMQMTCLPSLRRGTDDWNTILTSLGKLYLLGHKVDWKVFDDVYIRNKVSLPFHPFHRKSFWVECNSGNETLIHPLVGYSLNNASNLNIFQNDLSTKSVPYLKDHCIGSRTIFPGAGYTEMCLSAGYFVAHGLMESFELPRRAIRIDDMRIDAPLELKEGCRCQVIVDLPEFTVSKQSGVDMEQNQGFRVKVFHQNKSSEDSNKWILHASTMFNPVASTKDVLAKWKPERLKEIISTLKYTSSDAFYKRADDSGLKFGESFRQIQRHWNVKMNDVDADEVVAQIRLPEDHHKYLLHPLIIDATFQASILTGMAYDQHTRLKVPIRVGSLTLLNPIEILSQTNLEESVLYIHMWSKNDKYSGFVASADFKPIAYLSNIELIETNVRTIDSVLEQQSSSIPDAWEEVWRTIAGPFSNQVELETTTSIFTDDAFQKQSSAYSKTSSNKVEIVLKTNRLLYLYVLNTLYDLGWQPNLNDTINTSAFCVKYDILPSFKQLVHYYFTVFEEEKILEYNIRNTFWKVTSLPPSYSNTKSEIEHLTDELSQTTICSAVVPIYKHISKVLSKILRGEESALAILFPTDANKQHYSADHYYQNYPGRQDVIDLLNHYSCSILKFHWLLNESKQRRVFRVLEVGSGTGSISQHVLEWLRKNWGDQFEYYYTDISQSFFAKAEKKFEEYSGHIKYTVFNLEEDPFEQGIPLKYFDFVVASDVLHATRNLYKSLVNIRQTMRPRASLCFTETIIAARDITYVFGLVEGYWRFEDFHWRPHHTCVDEKVWSKVLELSGFKSVNSAKAYAGTFGIIAAEAAEDYNSSRVIANPVAKIRKNSWVFFCTKDDSAIFQVANILYAYGADVVIVFKSSDDAGALQKARQSLNSKISMTTIIAESEDPTSIEKVVTKEGLKGIVYAWTMDTKEFDQKRLALPFMHIAKWILVQKKPPSLFILTKGVHSINESNNFNPSAATIFGMAKSLKNENSELFVRYIDLEGDDSGKVVDEVLYELVMCKGPKEGSRVQIVYRNSQRYEPKFVKATAPKWHDELQLPPSTDRYQLVLPKTRLIQDLVYDTLEVEEMHENNVEIKIKAYALNFKDILTILKPSPEFEKLNTVGLDFSGVVSKVGSKVISSGKFKVGDRVFGANFKEAQLPSHLVFDTGSLLHIPEKMTFWEAATLPAVFATAFYCLHNISNMKRGDTVLIHTGSGGVGLASIQLAKHVGATIITTAGSSRKRTYLRSLGVDHVFHSRNTSYEQDIMRVTGGRGVDIVLNTITGQGFKEATLASCAKNARFVEISKLTIWSAEEVKTRRSDIDYSIVDLTAVERSEWIKLLENMAEYLNKGYLKPIPYVKFDALNIRQALQFFQKARHVGKVVCVMPEVFKQDGQIKHDSPLFNNESTYLITGGLGGIGFEVCKWMLEKGATEIVLTARNPPKADVAAVISDLNKKGFKILVRLGDVSNFNQCKCIFDDIGANGKPLRGVMHCSGVLRDNLYANQTWERFDDTFKPKITGTWNLHELTKHLQLEHFVLYSSITALVGTPSQPNHAAANCFEDAFAHYRHSLGLPATSINWGQWAQVGCAKEIAITGLLPVSVKRMMNGLELALKTQKLQVCYSEFEAFTNLAILCPLTKSYLDEKLLKQLESVEQSNQGLDSETFWSEMSSTDEIADKINIVGIYLKVILRTALRLDTDEPIIEDANIQDLGVDSLMLIELKNSIQTLLGSKATVTAGLLKNCSTVRQLATAIVQTILENNNEQISVMPLSTGELRLLVEQDCQLDGSIQSIEQTTSTMKPSNIQTILLTGATGQLGAYILAELSNKYTNVTKIFCLVRDIRGTTPEKRLSDHIKSLNLTYLVDMSKVVCVKGDVTNPFLGMEQESYDSITQSVDAVIHCAGNSNCNEQYKNYANGNINNIRSVNVGGTINVLKFASDQKIKHVYFTSSVICGLFTENVEDTLSDEWPEMEVLKAGIEARLPGLHISKFVCEQIIKQANLRGIPCKVFRFPWIAGHSKTGHLDYLNNMYILRYISFLKVNAMPALTVPANVLPIDFCAAISLQLFFNVDTPFEIYNISHPRPQMEQEFVHLAKEELGTNLEILEFQEFAERLRKYNSKYQNDFNKGQESLSMHFADAVGILKGYIVSPDNFFHNEKITRFIPDFEKKVSVTSMEIVRNDLRYLNSIGLIEKFRLAD